MRRPARCATSAGHRGFAGDARAHRSRRARVCGLREILDERAHRFFAGLARAGQRGDLAERVRDLRAEQLAAAVELLGERVERVGGAEQAERADRLRARHPRRDRSSGGRARAPPTCRRACRSRAPRSCGRRASVSQNFATSGITARLSPSCSSCSIVSRRTSALVVLEPRDQRDHDARVAARADLAERLDGALADRRVGVAERARQRRRRPRDRRCRRARRRRPRLRLRIDVVEPLDHRPARPRARHPRRAPCGLVAHAEVLVGERLASDTAARGGCRACRGTRSRRGASWRRRSAGPSASTSTAPCQSKPACAGAAAEQQQRERDAQACHAAEYVTGRRRGRCGRRSAPETVRRGGRLRVSTSIAHSHLLAQARGQVEVEHRLVFGERLPSRWPRLPVQRPRGRGAGSTTRCELLGSSRVPRTRPARRRGFARANDAEHLPRDRIARAIAATAVSRWRLRGVDLAPGRERLAELAMREADAERDPSRSRPRARSTCARPRDGGGPSRRSRRARSARDRRARAVAAQAASRHTRRARDKQQPHASLSPSASSSRCRSRCDALAARARSQPRYRPRRLRSSGSGRAARRARAPRRLAASRACWCRRSSSSSDCCRVDIGRRVEQRLQLGARRRDDRRLGTEVVVELRVEPRREPASPTTIGVGRAFDRAARRRAGRVARSPKHARLRRRRLGARRLLRPARRVALHARLRTRRRRFAADHHRAVLLR